MNYVTCLFKQVQNISLSGQSVLFDFLRHSILFFVLCLRVAKYWKIWCFLFSRNATAELNKLSILDSFSQFQQSIVVTLVAWLFVNILFRNLKLSDLVTILELTILSRIKINSWVRREVFVVHDYVGTGQYQIWRDEQTRSCLESVARTSTNNSSYMLMG